MTHLTTLLVVLTLTGAPMADALSCGKRCDRQTLEQELGRVAADPMSIGISDGSSTCATLLTESPFLKEEAAVSLDSALLLAATPATALPLPGAARPRSMSSEREAIEARSHPALVLRL